MVLSCVIPPLGMAIEGPLSAEKTTLMYSNTHIVGENTEESRFLQND